MREKTHDLRLRGMITVEAALLVPVIIIAILSLLMVGFYYLDRARISETCERVTVYMSRNLDHPCDLISGSYSWDARNATLAGGVKDSTFEKDLEDRISEELSGGLMLLQVQEVDVKNTAGTVKVKVSGYASSGIWKGLHPGRITYRWKTEIDTLQAAEFMRKTGALTDG